MEEDSLLCAPVRKSRPSWAIGLQQYHTLTSLTIEEKIILDRQLGIISSLKILSKGTIRTILSKLAIEKDISLADLSEQLPLPDLLKEYIFDK